MAKKTKILLLGGTAEAVDLADRLNEMPALEVISSLAGRTHAPRLPQGKLRQGGFGGTAGLVAYMRSEAIDLLIDATHPFAEMMHSHAVAAAAELGRPALRLHRPAWQREVGDDWYAADDAAEAARLAPELGRRALLATGQKTFDAFAGLASPWFLVRSIEKPDRLPLQNFELHLARGPFSPDEEIALLRAQRIDLVIAKNSGGPGRAKLTAAAQLDLPALIISRPKLPEGYAAIVESADQAIVWLQDVAR